MRVRGLDRLRSLLAEDAVLVVSNHTSFWDALVVLEIGTRLVRAETYAMMDAKNLERLPFFALVGAFGVNRSSARDGARAVRYAASLLDRSGRLVWIFPQGEETPVTTRPLGFQRGSALVARLAPRARVVPVALRYEHGELAQADLYVSIGDPTDDDHERAVIAELDRIERALEEDDEGFEVVFSRRESLSLRIGQALLALLTRPLALRGPRDA